MGPRKPLPVHLADDRRAVRLRGTSKPGTAVATDDWWRWRSFQKPTSSSDRSTPARITVISATEASLRPATATTELHPRRSTDIPHTRAIDALATGELHESRDRLPDVPPGPRRRRGDCQVPVHRIARLREHCGSVSRGAGRVSVSLQPAETKCLTPNPVPAHQAGRRRSSPTALALVVTARVDLLVPTSPGCRRSSAR